MCICERGTEGHRDRVKERISDRARGESKILRKTLIGRGRQREYEIQRDCYH